MLGELQNFNPSLSYTLYDDHIFSADMSTCLLLIEPVHASSDTSGNDALIAALDRMLEEFPHEGIDAVYFGTPGIAVYNARQIKNDTYVTLSVALLLIVGVITFSFRNRWSVLLITLPVCFGGLFALACIALITATSRSSPSAPGPPYSASPSVTRSMSYVTPTIRATRAKS